MAVRPRRTVTRSTGRKKKPRAWLWLLLGLGLGAATMYGVQTYLYKDRKPFTGIANLLNTGKPVAGKPAETVAKAPEPERLPKPKLDFYTILPGETVLPDVKTDSARKTGRPDAPEKGVNYILQAAAFTSSDDADRLKAKLVLNGLEPHIEKITVGDKGTYYRVRLGPYSNLGSLDAANAKLAGLGIKAIRIKARKPAAP